MDQNKSTCAELLEDQQLSESEAKAFGNFLSRITPAILSVCTIDQTEMYLTIAALKKVRTSMAMFGISGDSRQPASTMTTPSDTFGTS